MLGVKGRAFREPQSTPKPFSFHNLLTMDYGRKHSDMSGATLYNNDSSDFDGAKKAETSYQEYNVSYEDGSPQSPLPRPRPQFAQNRASERVSFAPPKCVVVL